MAITARDSGGGGSYEPCPVGLHRAVCCDVVDKGLVPTPWGEKHKVQLRWQTEKRREDGKPYMIFGSYTLSLHEKANLRGTLESWRGRPFSEDELSGFDLESLLGANCQIQVVHDETGKYANIKGIVSAAEGLEPLVVDDYTRVSDAVVEVEEDDDVPF